MLRLTVGKLVLLARLETERAPRTCAAIESLLPFESQLIQARWSGEAAWVPMGDRTVGVGFENHTSFPAPGELLFYPGGYSETEILLPYGGTRFASKMGQLAGNHFATIDADRATFAEIGRLVLWEGAQPIRLESA